MAPIVPVLNMYRSNDFRANHAEAILVDDSTVKLDGLIFPSGRKIKLD